MASEIHCFSYFLAKEECRAQLLTALQRLIPLTHQETHCLQYELLVDIDNPLYFIMVERFTSAAALAEHENQPYIKNFVDNEMDVYCEKVHWNVAQKIDF